MPKRSDISSILIIGAGPIIIGQACEFDYSGTQACKALKVDEKIISLYQRYRQQYAYMESSIASMQETGNMLESAFKQSD